ncbi:MAG TPA: hypothetical protein VMS18_10665 [Candidatus Binatia bacterium]|nr:hypothetical protein [Candidatus Binatia bacterium]
MTSGVMEEHESVIPPPVGVEYPYTGFTVTVPWAPLPATTLLGAMLLVTLMVNCGDTASTVRGIGGVVYVVVGPVPVIATLYSWVVVVLWVVTVRVAAAGVVTVAGLTMQTGGSVAGCDAVTWQLKFTVTLGLLVGTPIVTREEETPLGATASGLNDAAVRVNSEVPCAMADGLEMGVKSAQAASRHTAAIPRRPMVDFTLDSDHSDLNMNGF